MTEHENVDETVAAEFASYRHVAGQAFGAPSAEAVFATARRRTVRRRAVAVVAVAAGVTTVLVTGTVVAGAITANEPEIPASPRPAPTEGSPSPSPDGGYDEGPPPVPDRGNQVQFLDDQTAARVRGMTVELPARQDSEVCPAGEYTFADGQATIGEHDSGYPWTYSVLVKGQRGIVADLDGEAGDEILVPLGCGINHPQFDLLALRQVGDGFQAMGYVIASGELGGPDRFFPDGDEIVVEVLAPGVAHEFEQRRRYRWDGSAFVQVGGRTEPPVYDVDPTTVDIRNWSFSLGIEDEGTPCDTGGTLSFVDGGSGVWPYVSEEDGVDWPAAEYLMYGVSRGSLDVGGTATPAVLVTLTCSRADGHTETWVHHVTGYPVVRVGDDGITGIVSHRIVDGLAEVTVQTANGEETRHYRTDGIGWEPVA